MLTIRKRFVLLIGIGCILWGYYQLFAADTDESLINKQITVLTEKGELKEKVIAVKSNAVVISYKGSIIEAPKLSVTKIDGLLVNEYETRRVMRAVGVSTLGGILIWIALFFL